MRSSDVAAMLVDLSITIAATLKFFGYLVNADFYKRKHFKYIMLLLLINARKEVIIKCTRNCSYRVL